MVFMFICFVAPTGLTTLEVQREKILLYAYISTTLEPIRAIPFRDGQLFSCGPSTSNA